MKQSREKNKILRADGVCTVRCSENLKKWKIVLAHPDSHGAGPFQPLEKNGIEIRVRFLFLFSYFQIIRFYIGFARKIQRKDFCILKSIFECGGVIRAT